MPGHVDIPRLRKGKVGGFFWYVQQFLEKAYEALRSGRSVYVACPGDSGPDFVNPTWRVRYGALHFPRRGQILTILGQGHSGTNRRLSSAHRTVSGGIFEPANFVPNTESTLQAFELTLTSQDVREAIWKSKIASLLGVEG